ncbi:hypothetical protein AG1IA_07425 [Rhizoctonia solani AG-1 IA]|uniref:Uncharacterized protein n=1 Tax=Thanatephorus cucumeris (strain AG1-IA) TaxID=983506 RepID=L8WQC9_THACA|nr:hypothetical protein AG1IA_07425 [Rhizoctonia solani AG-1 IA]
MNQGETSKYSSFFPTCTSILAANRTLNSLPGRTWPDDHAGEWVQERAGAYYWWCRSPTGRELAGTKHDRMIAVVPNLGTDYRNEDSTRGDREIGEISKYIAISVTSGCYCGCVPPPSQRWPHRRWTCRWLSHPAKQSRGGPLSRVRDGV